MDQFLRMAKDAGQRMQERQPSQEPIQKRRAKPMDKGLRGPKEIIRADVFRCNRMADCTNGGISSSYDSLRIWSDFDVNAPPDAVVIVTDFPCGELERVRAVPAWNVRGPGQNWAMFGGNFLYSCDSRFPGGGFAIPIHDRFEEN